MAKIVGVRRFVWPSFCGVLLAAVALAVSLWSSPFVAGAQTSGGQESTYVADYLNADVSGWNDLTGGTVVVPYLLDSGPAVTGIGNSFSLSYVGTLSGVAGTGYFIPARTTPGNDLVFRPDDVGTPPVIGATFSATFELEAPPAPGPGFALANSNVRQGFSGFTGSTSNVIAQLQTPFALIDHGQTGNYVWNIEVGGLGDTIINSPRYDSRGVSFVGGFASNDPATQTHISYVSTPPQQLCNGLAVTVDIGAGDSPTGVADVILGTSGPDVINGLAGDDVICGLGGDDTINAGAGDDVVFGDGGADTLNGAAGDDVLRGGSGDDVIIGASGDDLVYGQAGIDTLSGNVGNDQIWGGSDDDRLNGGPGNDVLRGQNGDDLLLGQAGDDLLQGQGGDDSLQGQAGDDSVVGGTGSDSCNGGSGLDSGHGSCETILGVP